MLGKEQVSTPVHSTKRSTSEPETETKQPQPDTQDNSTTASSPSQPIRRIRDLPTVHKAKRSLRFQRPLSKLALELYSESKQSSEFFRCYLEEDVVDKEDIRGQVQLNSGDDDQESGEELVEQVKPYLMDMLERAILAAL